MRYAFCPNMKLIMIAEHAANPKVIDMVHVRCKQWSCEFCAQRNATAWKNHLLTRMARYDFIGEQWCLITITAHENAHKAGPIYTLKNLQRGWTKLYHRLKRWNKVAFEFVRIFEKHTNGEYGGYHMHILASCGDAWVYWRTEIEKVYAREERARALKLKPRKRLKKEKSPYRWIKDNAASLGMGNQADFSYVGRTTAGTARYATKYIAKQIEILEFPPRMRRIQASRGLTLPKRNKTGNIRKWRAKSAIYRDDVLSFDKIYDMTARHVVTIEDDFSNGEMWYPPELK